MGYVKRTMKVEVTFLLDFLQSRIILPTTLLPATSIKVLSVDR